MKTSLNRRALELLDAALEMPEQDVGRFLDEACGGDSELRTKIESLMAAMGNSSFLPSAPTPTHDTVQGAHRPVVFQPGSELAGRYTVIASIGSGGMGEVYCATDRMLDRQVAIKTLNVASLGNQEMRDRFVREMKSIASLHDPNIVTLFDIATEGEIQFAVMELVEGETLRQLIGKGLQQQTALRIAREVASGLRAAHLRGLMHRDIKPENIIIATTGTAKILDFGLARNENASAEQQLTVSSLTPGTIPYMSPEQAAGADLTCATDVFSLGTVVYEILTGVNPFRGKTALDTLQRIGSADPPRISDSGIGGSPGLTELVSDMLKVRPVDRPSASELVSRFESLIDTSPGQVVIASGLRTELASRHEVSKRDWQPSLAVLPFQCFGNAVDLEPIADGLVENLTTVLTRVPLLAVTSRMSSFSLKDQSATAEEVRRRLGVEYMLEGSLQKFDERVRANVQLIKTQTGFHLWAQQFDCSMEKNVVQFLLQDILTRLEPQLSRAISNDLSDASGEPSSQQLLIRAMSLLSIKGWHRDSFAEVAGTLRKAIELAPEFALAHANLALILGLGKRVGLVADGDEAAREAIAHAERAMDLDELDSNVLGLAGCALSDVGQTNRAAPLLLRAIELNPLNAQAHAALGTTYLVTEDYQAAIEQLNRGIDLSPADGRLAVWYSTLAIAQLFLNDTDAALSAAQRGCQSDRKTYLPWVVLTAVHLARDEQAEASSALDEGLRVKPDLSKDEISHLVGREFGIAIRKLLRRRS